MKAQPANNIKALSEKKGISARRLAKLIGTSAPHMSRLINGKSPLKTKWLKKLSTALKVPVDKIVDIKPHPANGKKPVEAFDLMLPGSIIGWLLEAADNAKTDLSRTELSRLTSYIYKEAINAGLSEDHIKRLAHMAVQIKQILG
ncbi:MAG: helix-turn-helix transcriptional regulator [Alphaproteobacteria bacterium]|nr:helix-turn-helix transcriptional regulator [Alphaproteobacteria bacterium]